MKKLFTIALMLLGIQAFALDGVPVPAVQWYINPSTGNILGYRNTVTNQDTTVTGVITSAAGAGANQQRYTQTTPPTCTSNCGTSPSVSGSDTSMTLTMGGTGSPASGFVITFNGTWASAPQCTGAMALTGMAVGKLPMVIVTTTTTITVTTNGVAPANSDKYHFRCTLGS